MFYGNVKVLMDVLSAQISLYPLRQESIGPIIREAVRVFRKHGLETRMGEMSTLVWGEEQVVFDAIQEAFHEAAEHGDTVMTVTFSNACPEPSRGGYPWPKDTASPASPRAQGP